MTSDPPAELARFTRFERRTANACYTKWARRYADRKSDVSNSDARRQVAHQTYAEMAGWWIGIACPLIFIAGCMWSFDDSVLQVAIASVLSAVALTPFTMGLIRFKQCFRYWPGKVRREYWEA